MTKESEVVQCALIFAPVWQGKAGIPNTLQPLIGGAAWD
jgi:hypothetical protein